MNKSTLRTVISLISGILVLPFMVYGAQIDVASDVLDAVVNAVAGAAEGDIINLTDAGPYQISQSITNTVSVTVQGDSSLDYPRIVVTRNWKPFFVPMADIKIKNLEIDGRIDGVWASGRGVQSMESVNNIWLEDCIFHHMHDDFFRTESDHGLVSLNNVFVYTIQDCPLDFRNGTLAMCEVKNTTFYNCTSGHRIALEMGLAFFDHITHVNTHRSVFNCIVAQSYVSVKNSLFINNHEAFLFHTEDGKTVDCCNIWNDPDLITAGILDTALKAGSAGEIVFNNGAGNFQENPLFADTAGHDFLIDPGTRSATGAEDGGPLGDPRWGGTSIVEKIESTILKNHTLHQNFPNPFNPETVIQYDLPIQAYVKVSIFNILGREVTELFKGFQSAGRYKVIWEGRSSDGRFVNSGVYFYRLETGNQVHVRKMLLLE